MTREQRAARIMLIKEILTEAGGELTAFELFSSIARKTGDDRCVSALCADNDCSPQDVLRLTADGRKLSVDALHVAVGADND